MVKLITFFNLKINLMVKIRVKLIGEQNKFAGFCLGRKAKWISPINYFFLLDQFNIILLF